MLNHPCAAESTIGIDVSTNPVINLDDGDIVSSVQTVTIKSTFNGGYRMSLQMADKAPSNNLVNANTGNEIAAVNGTMNSPQQLDPGTWGFAVAGLAGFDQAYEALPNIASRWAAVPMSGDDNIIMQSNTISAAGGDSMNVYYAARRADNIIAGNYVGQIIYTAVGDEIEPPQLSSISPNTYNLGNTSMPARVTITGSNLNTVNQVCVDFDDDGSCDDGENADQVMQPTYDTLTYDLPNSADISVGTYDVCVVSAGGSDCLDKAFTYTRSPEITDMTPDSFDLDGDRPINMVGGQNHSMILTESGEVFTYGSNSSGQLGTGDGIDHGSPTNITNSFAGKVVQISALGDHSLALTESGRVYSWGDNKHGQVGDGTTTNAATPVDITNYFKLPAGTVIVKIYAGWEMSFAIDNSGAVYVWGRNNRCQLGLGDTANRTVPTKMDYPFDGKVVTLAVDSHVLALTDTGHLYGWGFNDHGQVDAESIPTNVSTPMEITDRMQLSDGVTIKSIGAASNASMVLLSDDTVWVWGQNDRGNLGTGSFISSGSSQPMTHIEWFPGDESIVDFSAGYYATIALTSTGKVYVWGGNDAGQLGLNDGVQGRYPRHDSPVELTTINGNITAVYATGNSLFAMTDDGLSYSWGGSGSIPTDVSSDINYSLLTLFGANLEAANSAFIDFDGDNSLDENERCADLKVISGSRITCSVPTDLANIKPGQYNVYITVGGENLLAPRRFTYYADGT